MDDPVTEGMIWSIHPAHLYAAVMLAYVPGDTWKQVIRVVDFRRSTGQQEPDQHGR